VNAIRLMEQVGMGDSAVAIPPLIAALRHTEPEVRVAACGALGPLVAEVVTAGTSADGARTAVTAVTGLLADPKPQVRIAAAEALSGMTSLKGSAGALIKGLDSHYHKIGIRACWLIAELGRDAGPAIPSLLKYMSYPIDTATIMALLRFGPKAANSVPRLRALVNDERPAVGAAAARALKVLEANK
jgi:HEAT repeat protein